MVKMDERQVIERVCARLVARFPDVSEKTGRLTVRDVHNRFDGRVRAYVPILVEREAGIRLAGTSPH